MEIKKIEIVLKSTMLFAATFINHRSFFFSRAYPMRAKLDFIPDLLKYSKVG